MEPDVRLSPHSALGKQRYPLALIAAARLAAWPTISAVPVNTFAPRALPRFLTTTSASAPEPSIGIRLGGVGSWVFPLAGRHQVLTFRVLACARRTPPLRWPPSTKSFAQESFS
jgi:hypothetical protein